MASPARTIAEMLAQLERFVPEYYEPAITLFAAAAATMALAEGEGEGKAAQIPIGGATGTLLTLLARGYGIRRGDAETDTALRGRLRAIEDRITRPSIIAAVEVLDPALVGNVRMIEWFDEPYVDADAYLDSTVISGGPRSFVLVVPLIGPYPVESAFVDVDAYLDVDAFVGGDDEDPIYNAIVAAVEERRGAGIRWRLRIASPVSP